MGVKTIGSSRILLAFVLAVGVLICGFLLSSHPTQAAPGVSQQMNFQGRLLNAQGATVADGFYNLEFKIYQDGDGQTTGNTSGSPAGTLKWTESHLNSNAQGVMVKNGYMSVQLGAVVPFGSSVDWNQDTLWLSMNIGSTNASCTPFSSCTPDGEMIPMKRLSSTPFALNSNLLGGLSSGQFLQLAQGVQTDVSTNGSSIHINKTGTGNLLQLQSDGSDSLVVDKNGNMILGSQTDKLLIVEQSSDDTRGKNLTIYAGDAGNTDTGSYVGGQLSLQGGYGSGEGGTGGDITIDAGGSVGDNDGNILIGTNDGKNIFLGKQNDVKGETQNIYVGNRTSAGTTNVTLGAGSEATNGSTTVQAKDYMTIKTNGTTRATFNNTNSLYLGNGVSAAAPSNFTISGTNSTMGNVAGGALTIQGGSASTDNANGGNVIIRGGMNSGSGAQGLVVISTPTFSTTSNDQNCYTGGMLVANNCTVATSSVDGSAAVIVGFNQNGKTASLPNPTNTTAGRILYVTAANGSADFTLSVNGGGIGNVVAMRQNTSATMIWNGIAWTAAGASSSTTLQSAYDNTLQSAGGAELIVGKTGNTNGLTIRDSTTNPVNGTLMSVQTSSAASLFSINSNVTEYSVNGGAELIGTSGDTSFPSNTWSGLGGSTVSRYITAGDYIATGKGSVGITTTNTASAGVRNALSTPLVAKTTYNVSFATRLTSGTFTDMTVHYSADGTAASVPCTTNQAVTTSVWTKVNCTFTAPASGITSGNAMLIRQAGGTARTFYVDNLSVTIAADYNYATDGGVHDVTNFGTNWSSVGGAAVTRSTTAGFDASDSARVITTAANQGVRNKLAINPLSSTLYRVTAYAASSIAGFNSFTIRYSPDGGSSFVNCADYNTQAVSDSLTNFTKITCYITTSATATTNPYLYFTQTDGIGRTFHVDTLSMTLSGNTTPNVQIGGGVNGGPVTLLTLDRAASAPIASNNEALLGSLYYDTSLGKLQCYEADGWGACGSSPDSIVTISPEYNNAVLHGTGVGTMVSDICSGPLNINNGTSGQPTICGATETYNFYKWTSPQASAQTYSIYVTYQLPTNFNGFASGQTSIMGRTDSTNASVNYQIYRNNNDTGMTPCGSTVSVSTGAATSWQTGIANGTADPSTCGFTAGNSIVFKINATASQNASAYIGNLNFTFNNR